MSLESGALVMILANYMIVVIFQLHFRRHVFVIAVANAIAIIMIIVVLTSTSSPGLGIAFLQQHAHAVTDTGAALQGPAKTASLAAWGGGGQQKEYRRKQLQPQRRSRESGN